jgi:hypothetical protein
MPFFQVLILAIGMLIPCSLGAMLMWDRIYHMLNSQMTNSQMTQMIWRIWMMNFLRTW